MALLYTYATSLLIVSLFYSFSHFASADNSTFANDSEITTAVGQTTKLNSIILNTLSTSTVLNGNSGSVNENDKENKTKPTVTTSEDGKGGIFGISMDNSAITRMMYVLLGLTAVLVIYFGVKIWRTSRRKSNIRRYDMLNNSPHVKTSLTNLDSESEDEIFADSHAKLVK